MRNSISEWSEGLNDITPHEMLLNCHQIIIIAKYEQVNFNLYSQTETTINVVVSIWKKKLSKKFIVTVVVRQINIF